MYMTCNAKVLKNAYNNDKRHHISKFLSMSSYIFLSSLAKVFGSAPLLTNLWPIVLAKVCEKRCGSSRTFGLSRYQKFVRSCADQKPLASEDEGDEENE